MANYCNKPELMDNIYGILTSDSDLSIFELPKEVVIIYKIKFNSLNKTFNCCYYSPFDLWNEYLQLETLEKRLFKCFLELCF